MALCDVVGEDERMIDTGRSKNQIGRSTVRMGDTHKAPEASETDHVARPEVVNVAEKDFGISETKLASASAEVDILAGENFLVELQESIAGNVLGFRLCLMS